jgi:hypothetical protein
MYKLFQDDIFENRLNDEQVFQKYFIDNETFFFKLQDNIGNWEYELKMDLANSLNIHMNDIYIVGSGKTGFSMKPKCRGRAFDGDYQITRKVSDKSDIDIAIVSNSLFDEVQENIYDWSKGFKDDWNSNSYYSDGNKRFGVSLKYKFLEYLGKGWYRPDLKPVDYKYQTKDSINLEDVLDKWRSRLNRKVAYAFYKNWHFFKKYQIETISSLRNSVKKELIK